MRYGLFLSVFSLLFSLANANDLQRAKALTEKFGLPLNFKKQQLIVRKVSMERQLKKGKVQNIFAYHQELRRLEEDFNFLSNFVEGRPYQYKISYQNFSDKIIAHSKLTDAKQLWDVIALSLEAKIESAFKTYRSDYDQFETPHMHKFKYANGIHFNGSKLRMLLRNIPAKELTISQALMLADIFHVMIRTLHPISKENFNQLLLVKDIGSLHLAIQLYYEHATYQRMHNGSHLKNFDEFIKMLISSNDDHVLASSIKKLASMTSLNLSYIDTDSDNEILFQIFSLQLDLRGRDESSFQRMAFDSLHRLLKFDELLMLKNWENEGRWFYRNLLRIITKIETENQFLLFQDFIWKLQRFIPRGSEDYRKVSNILEIHHVIKEYLSNFKQIHSKVDLKATIKTVANRSQDFCLSKLIDLIQ